VDDPRPVPSPLPDVTGLSFAAMRARRDSALARSLRQVIASLVNPHGVISAFQSFASDT
jgi:FXSXX-COOH protein